MLEGFELHSGYKVAVSIAHQGTDLRIGALFIIPYITRLVRGMCILEGTDNMRMVGGVASMSLETLRSMGMLQSVHTAHEVDNWVQ